MSAQPDFAALSALLEAEEPLVSRLESVLEAEYAAITGREAAAIEQAARDKQEVVGELDRLDQTRRRWLSATELGVDRNGFEALVACHDNEAGELAARWQALREHLERCRHANTRNGRLIEPARRVTEQAIAILLGNDLSTQTYDQHGARRGQGSGGHTSFKV